MKFTNLQRILPRESLFTKGTRKRLDSQMNLLVSFQVVVPVEALGTLVALEGPVLVCLRLVRVAIHVQVVRSVRRRSGVVASGHHAADVSDGHHGRAGLVHVGHDGPTRSGHLVWERHPLPAAGEAHGRRHARHLALSGQ